MATSGQGYCGDAAMRQSLALCGSKRTLHEIYGLFHGCAAAPGLVMPSAYMDLILGAEEDRMSFETLEDANKALGNLMSLWNYIAGWTPGQGRNIYPDEAYPETRDGLRTMVRDHAAFISFFIKGMDLGGLQEADLRGDVMAAFRDLASNGAIHEKLVEVLDKDASASESVVAGTRNQVCQLEEVMLHCVARINTGLRGARQALAGAIGRPGVRQDLAPAKISGNQFCPCGSGKKYKKCCGGSA